MASLNPYAKVNEADQERLIAAHEARRRKIIFGFSFIAIIILICIVVATVTGVISHRKDQEKSSMSSNIKAICDLTLYPASCYSSLAPLFRTQHHFEPQDIFKASIQVAINELLSVSDEFNNNGRLKNVSGITDYKNMLAALESCQELLFLALGHLNTTLTFNGFALIDAFDDLTTWLSTAGTYQQTCIDGFQNSSLSSIVLQTLKNSTEFTSNSLAIITSIESMIASFGKRRHLMSLNEMPKWLSRKLLVEATSNYSSIAPDAVVAQDGSGNYTTINAALENAPDNSKKRHVIYIKKGVYVENVRVKTSKRNVMMIGDGMNDTLVSGSLNFVDGTPTFNTATFAVFGPGFIARDMGFLNTAGAPKQQAVALFSSSDQSIFYRCLIDAFQDTLYTHSNRQFYRECEIYGTVDFIFGNSAVVFQNCNILPRRPMAGQQNTITAQGKIDPNQNTGISIQNCTISPLENLSGVSSYLGRPWKNYSTTVYMQNVISGFIDPKGWLPWVGTTAAPNTTFYAEYQNSGPGSVTAGRVNWKGLKLNMTSKQAAKYSVGSFIKGNKWIPATNISYNSGL